MMPAFSAPQSGEKSKWLHKLLKAPKLGRNRHGHITPALLGFQSTEESKWLHNPCLLGPKIVFFSSGNKLRRKFWSKKLFSQLYYNHPFLDPPLLVYLRLCPVGSMGWSGKKGGEGFGAALTQGGPLLTTAHRFQTAANQRWEIVSSCSPGISKAMCPNHGIGTTALLTFLFAGQKQPLLQQPGST